MTVPRGRNELALGFYGTVGFDPYRHEMVAPTEELYGYLAHTDPNV